MGLGIVRFKGHRDSQGTSRRGSGGQARINVGRLAAAPIAGSIIGEAKHREIGSSTVQQGDGRLLARALRQSRSTNSGRPFLPKEVVDGFAEQRLEDGVAVGSEAAGPRGPSRLSRSPARTRGRGSRAGQGAPGVQARGRRRRSTPGPGSHGADQSYAPSRGSMRARGGPASARTPAKSAAISATARPRRVVLGGPTPGGGRVLDGGAEPQALRGDRDAEVGDERARLRAAGGRRRGAAQTARRARQYCQRAVPAGRREHHGNARCALRARDE